VAIESSPDGTSSDERGIAHNVDVTKLELRNWAGETLDLKYVFTELTFKTSIFEYFISGTLTVYDAIGMLAKFPIVGEEHLDVSFETPDNGAKTGTFRVWKVTDEQPDRAGQSMVYTLHFCSPEVFRNAFSQIMRSYTTTDDAGSIIKDILTRDLQSGKLYQPTEMKDPAKKLVIPNYSPFEAIDMLLRRGYKGVRGKSDYFLFWERHDGYYLRMFEDLVSQPVNKREQGAPGTPGEPGTTPGQNPNNQETWYAYASDKYVNKVGDEDSVQARDIRRIINYQVHSRFDTLQKIREGLYENETVLYSIMEKSITESVFKHERDGFLVLGGFGNGEDAKLNTQQFIGEWASQETGYAYEQASKTILRQKDPEEKPNVVKKGGGMFQSVRVALSQMGLTITVPGDTMVDAGDLVRVVIPIFESVENKGEPDPMLSGKWIVGSVSESILAPDKHVMVLDLYRDAYWKDIGRSSLDDEGGTGQ